jgi:hypothetical protein
MFLAEITTLSENAGPFYPCLIRLVNSAEHQSITNLGSPAKSSTMLRPSKLRTRKCGMSPHSAVLRRLAPR